jgi:Flp pilus assembly protein TadG
MDMRLMLRRMFESAAWQALKQKSTQGEEGLTILETAMSSLMLFTFIFGIMEIAFAAYSYHAISESAREGTRYAIIRGSTAAGSAGTACAAPGPPTCVAQSADIQTYVKGIGFPGINPGNMTVTPTWSAFTQGFSCPVAGPCNSPGNLITITVQYNFPVSLPFVSITSIAMSTQSAMIISQ